MEGKDEHTSVGPPGRSDVGEHRRRPTRLWAVIVSCVVGGVASIASQWLSTHLFGITAEQRVFAVDFGAFLVPMLVLDGPSESLDLDQPGHRRCFLLICVAVLAAAIPSQLLALVILRPWLDAEAGILTQIGLMLPAYAILIGAVMTASKAATRLCAGPGPAADTSDGDQ